MAHSQKRSSDQERHTAAWEDAAREWWQRIQDRGVRNLVKDPAYFWQKVESLAGDDCGRDLFKARAKVGDLITQEKARARLDHWAYSANKLMALAQLAEAIGHKIQEEKYGRSYLP